MLCPLREARPPDIRRPDCGFSNENAVHKRHIFFYTYTTISNPNEGIINRHSPIGALKCNFPAFWEVMTNRPTKLDILSISLESDIALSHDFYAAIGI